MIVQIYETQTAAEAASLVLAGVDNIGVLTGGGKYPREFSPEQAVKILEGATGAANKVVMSLSDDLEEIISIVNKTDPDILHLGASTELLLPEGVRHLKQMFPKLAIMRSLPVLDETVIELARAYEGIADFFLLDTLKNGQFGATGETHDWNLSKKVVESVQIPVILAGGLGPDNAAEAIKQVRPYGVDSKTKTDKPGSSEKDADKVREFVKAAKSAVL